MKNTTAVICEYNPMHKGHLYHLHETRRLTQNRILCLQSGAFVQRGEPAVFDKFKRASAAVSGGADCVVELPFSLAISAANVFAQGAVKMLNAIPTVTELSFGVENATLEALKQLADILCDETASLSHAIQVGLKTGVSYPRAQAEAVKQIYGEIGNLLDSANNILAIEYLKALTVTRSKIQPVAIARVGDNYRNALPKSEYPSATAIRNLMADGKDVSKYLAQGLCASDAIDLNAAQQRLYLLLRAKLFETTPQALASVPDVKEGLEYSLIKAAQGCANYAEFIDRIKSKRFTRASLNRIFLNILTDSTAADRDRALSHQVYNVLCVKDADLLKVLPQPILSMQDFHTLQNAQASAVAAQILRADKLYDLISANPHLSGKSFFTKK